MKKKVVFVLLSVIAAGVLWSSCAAQDKGKTSTPDAKVNVADPDDTTTAGKLPWAKKIVGFALIVKPEKAQVGLARAVILDVQLRNTTSKEMSLPQSKFMEDDWYFIVKDTDGKPVPTTRLGKLLREPHRPLNSVADDMPPVKPGASYNFKVAINSIYDMTIAQKYTIVVKHIVDNLLVDGKMASKVLVADPVTVEVGEYSQGSYIEQTK